MIQPPPLDIGTVGPSPRITGISPTEDMDGPLLAKSAFCGRLVELNGIRHFVSKADKEVCVKSDVGNPRRLEWGEMRIICASESCSQRLCRACTLSDQRPWKTLSQNRLPYTRTWCLLLFNSLNRRFPFIYLTSRDTRYCSLSTLVASHSIHILYLSNLHWAPRRCSTVEPR